MPGYISSNRYSGNRLYVYTISCSVFKGPGGAGGGSGTPGGSDTQIQFNDSSSFGGDAQFTWNKTTNTVTLAGAMSSQAVSSGRMRTSTFIANANMISGLKQPWFNSGAANKRYVDIISGNLRKMPIYRTGRPAAGSTYEGAIIMTSGAGTANSIARIWTCINKSNGSGYQWIQLGIGT
jgi:hypothetical protein